MWVIDREALERAIDERSAVIDALKGGRSMTRDTALAIKLANLTAEHNALVTLLNCLREHKTIWDVAA